MAARRSGSLVQWTRRPGPVGGVTTAVERVTEDVRAAGHEVRYVNTASAPQALSAFLRLAPGRHVHLFHITRLWRALVLAPVFALLRGPAVLVLHSGSVGRQVDAMTPWRRALFVVGLRAYTQIWAVNADMRAGLPAQVRGRSRVVRPGTGSADLPGPPPVRDPHLLAVATNSGKAYYGAELALEAVAELRATWPDARLWVLAYDQELPELTALRQRVAGLPWVTLTMNLGAAETSGVLASAGVLLRPTSWDGDSVIVREALDRGARVVASDVVPRPAGVELADLSAGGFAAAVLSGGRPSTGEGLGDLTLSQAALGLLGDGPNG